MSDAAAIKTKINQIAAELGEDNQKIMAYCVANKTMIRLNPGNPRVPYPVKSAVLDMLARQFLSDYEWELMEIIGGPPQLFIGQQKCPHTLYPC